MEKRTKNIEVQVKNILEMLSELDRKVTKVQSNLDEHLLEHMIEDRNREFDLEYPIEDD